MSITEKILELLNTKTSNYKGVPINCFGLPVFKEYNKQSIRNSFSKLHSKNLIEYNSSYIKITKEGEKYLKRKSKFLRSFKSDFSGDEKKNLLILFDIQENRKAEREWFRRHLLKFGYIMIQKSVWVGPSPLPNEFKDYVKKIKLDESIKTFKLEMGYQNKKIGL